MQLRHLELTGCRLTQVPAGVARLAGLTHLSLADNFLEALPPSLAQLQQLAFLSASQNREMTELLPAGPFQLSLTSLQLNGCAALEPR